MTKLVFIGGPMGVGKSTVTHLLCSECAQSVMLDGDWCWFQGDKEWDFSDKTKQMALNNIAYLLNSFLQNKAFDTVFFCWVLHEASLEASLLNRLTKPFDFYHFSLICTPDVLKKRIFNRAGLTENQKEAQWKRAQERLSGCRELKTMLLDTSDLTAVDVCQMIKECIHAD